MLRTARLLIRYRLPIATALAILTVLAGWRALNLDFDFSFRTLFLGTSEDELAREMDTLFGDHAGSFLVAVLQGPEVFHTDVLKAIAVMSDEVEIIPHVVRVFSLATVPYIASEGDSLSFGPVTGLIEDGHDAVGLRASVLASPLYAQRLVSKDGKTTAIVALVDPTHRTIAARAPTVAAFRAAVTAHAPAGFRILFTGYPVTEAEYARLVLQGMLTSQAVGLLLMAFALYLCFRTLAAIMLPLAVVSIATVLVLGFMERFGQHLTFTNASVPLLMLVLGVAEVSFFLSRYYEEAATHGYSAHTAVNAVASTLWPGFIAALTTAVGFLALRTGHIALTREFGNNMAIAGLVTYGVAALVMPGALARLGPPPERTLRMVTVGVMVGALDCMATTAIRWPKTIALIAIAIISFGGWGATRIERDQYATRELPADHPIQHAQNVVDSELMGAFQTHVGIRARDGERLTTPERLRDIAALQTFLARQPNVVKTWSIVDYVQELDKAMRHDGRTIPASAALVEQYLLLLSSGSRTTDVGDLLDPTHSWAAIVFGMTDLGTDALRALRRHADTFVHDALKDRIQIRFLGDYWQIARGNEIVGRDQLMSVIGAIALLTPFVGVLLRSSLLTVLCLPPNILPLIATLGLMGVGGYDLRTGTSIILPVALGITVDMTTHLFTRVREEWSDCGSYSESVRRALRGTGWGIVASTVTLVMGFTAYLVPPFASFHDVGILASWTFTVALFANLLLAPVLILWIRPFGGHPSETGAKPVGETAAP